MSGLVRGDFFEVGVESGIEASGCEVGFGEVAESFSVESVFKMLEGKSVVEDVSVSDCWCGLTDLLQERATLGTLESTSSERRHAFKHSRSGNWA